jgi:hypothetical protein
MFFSIEDDSVEYVSQEIARFLSALKNQQFLTNSQFRRLSKLLLENSNLLFAAYSVAISANDSEYFAEICKDVANSLETEQGQNACEAQDEVLQICDQLYINDKITENQLLYLRHLILIREEAVATLYDEYQEHQSIPLLAKSLYELANTHPFQSSSGEGYGLGHSDDIGITPGDDENDTESNDEDDDGNESSDSEDMASPDLPKRKSHPIISKGLSGVIALMGRSGIISRTEASVLHELVEQENDIVLAAYELYEKDKNLEELQDTLVRCAKLEVRKRVTDIQEKELEALQKESAGWKNEEFKRKYEDEQEKQQESERENSTTDEDEVNDAKDDGDSSYDGTDEQDKEDEMGLEDIGLSTILQSMNVLNVWEKSVPELFIKTVFIAVIRNQLTVEQAKTLCDLFHARYDLVHAAWEVFTVQKDAIDFVDTLRRIARDITVSDIREEVTEEMKHSSSPPSSKSDPSQPYTSFETATSQQSLQERKAEALMAVTAAKRELLKHSLEMMVKQQMTTAEKAGELYARYLSGDILCDAAIEAYATDRDVGEFLDTLQVLANNSKEDLENLMRAVASKGDDDDDDDVEEIKKESSQTDKSSSSFAQQTPSSGDIETKEDLALKQIDEVVSEMLKNDMIGPGITEEFRKLIRSRDERLIEAYRTYQENKSGAELVNTLLKVVIASVEAAPKASSSSSSQSSVTAFNTGVSEHAQSSKPVPTPPQEKNEKSQTALDPSDQKTVVEILMR